MTITVRSSPVTVYAALLLLFAAPVSAQFFGSPDDAAAVFRNALDDGNVAQALNLLAPNVLVYVQGREDRSRDAYVEKHLKQDISELAGFYSETLNQHSSVSGDTAWVTSRTRYLSKAPENPVGYIGTETLILRRLASGWQIVHVHRSASATESAH